MERGEGIFVLAESAEKAEARLEPLDCYIKAEKCKILAWTVGAIISEQEDKLILYPILKSLLL